MSRHFTGKCALVVSHPGHELRVHGWLEIAQPDVYVLTDGSGRSSQSRLTSTTNVLRQAGARPGAIYGRYSDRELYAAVLRRDLPLFRDLVTELAAELSRERYDFVLSDGAEGLILAHDLCRGIVDAAVACARGRSNGPVASYSFTLDGLPVANPSAPGAITYRLDAGALQRKIAAARSYAELRHETEEALSAYGEAAFGAETLFPVGLASPDASLVPPAYERHGEQLVAEGIYPAVVRQRDHVSPILMALRNLPEAA